jgi:hypothetical protein
MSAFDASDFIEGVEGVPFADAFACKLEAPVSDFAMRKWTDNFETMYDRDMKEEYSEAGDPEREGFLCEGEEAGLRLMQKYSQLTKRKPIESMRKKKLRLKGDALLNSLRAHPVFQNHEELFDSNLDDKARKKVMQKIRNRISAQESRDRKKNQFSELVHNNISLIKNSMNMKKQIDELQRENLALKGQMTVSNSQSEPTQEGVGNLSQLKSLFTSKGRLPGKPDWKSFSLFMLTMVIYCVLYPDQKVLKEKLMSEEFSLSNYNVGLISPSLLSKIQGLCNSFGEKVGLDCTFDFSNLLLAKSVLPLERQLLDLGFDEPKSGLLDPTTDRTHVDLAEELIKQFETIIEETQDTHNDELYLKNADLDSPEGDPDGGSNSRSSKSISMDEEDLELLETPQRVRASSFK